MAHRPDSLIERRGRRRFLMGGAAVLALPFLESLARPKNSYAWTPVDGMPKRLIVFFHRHGSIMEEFVPGPNMSVGAILQPVVDAGLLDKSLVVTGVNMKTAQGHDGAPSLLTCTPLGDPDASNSYGQTPSIEHVIARHMQDGGLPRRFDVTVANASTDSDHNGIVGGHTRLFWSGDNEHIESIAKPELAFDHVFPDGPPDPQEPAPTVDYRALRRRSVLDGVLGNFNQLQGRVSASDRARLEAHAERLREIEQSLESGGPGAPPPGCSDGLDVPLVGLTHEEVANSQVDILAHAIACNVADVGTFKIGDLQEEAWGHINHPELGMTFNGGLYHGAWHSASDGIPHARRAFTAINAWFGSLFARLLSNLDQIDDGDGTALDNTMVVWASDFGHGGGHRGHNLPIVIAGNAGGAALGRHVDLSEDGYDPASSIGGQNQPGNHNLAVTMAQAFGIAGDTFGDYQNTIQPVEPGPLAL